MNLEYLFQDGANVQAQIVAILLRDKYEIILEKTYDKDFVDRFRGRITIGRLENCREQGYVVSLRCLDLQRNYAFFEHRNSDRIHILINDTYTIDTPSVDVMWEGKKDKYDTDMAFDYGQWDDCATYIAKDMMQTLDKWIDEEKIMK